MIKLIIGWTMIFDYDFMTGYDFFDILSGYIIVFILSV